MIMTKIKKQWYLPIIAFIAILLGLVSCSTNDDDPQTKEDVQVAKIDISILKGPNANGVPSPRMVVKVGDWNIIEYTSDGLEHDAMTVLHFVNSNENTSMIVAGYDSTVMFYECDPFSNVNSDTVIIATEKHGRTCMATCLMDWSNNSYKTLLETVFGKISKLRAATRMKDDFADIRASFSETLDKLSHDISTLSEYPSAFSKSVGCVAEIWTKVAIPWAKYSLYEGNPEMQEEIRDNYVVDRFEEYYLSIVPEDLSQLYQNAMHVYEISKELFPSFPHTFTNTEMDNISYRIAASANASYLPQISYEEENLKYEVSAGVSSVGETSVNIYASCSSLDNQPSYISEYGIDIIGSNGERKSVKVSNFDRDIIIDGLTPGIVYTAMAYVMSFGKRYECSFMFMTKCKFGLYPESLTFNENGGTKVVTFNISKEGLKSWSIKSKPNWCEIEKGQTSFFVKVNETKKKRQGNIVVIAELYDGSNVEAQLSIVQESDSWNGTKWNFKGSISVSGNTDIVGDIDMANVTNFGIEIRNVENNDFTFTGDLAGIESASRIYCDEEGRLVWSYDDSYYDSGVSVKSNTTITFTRTGTSTAKGILKGYSHVNLAEYGNVNIEMNGDFTGKRIDTDN